MKRLFTLLFAIALLGQYTFAQTDEIPVKDGKVVFTQTIETSMSAEEIHDSLTTWLGEHIEGIGTVNADNEEQNMIVCRFSELTLIQEHTLMVFELFVNYTAIFEYKDKECLVTVKNISYIEPEDKNGKETPTIFSAEKVLLEKEYKRIFIKDAVGKIAHATSEKMNNFFKNIDNILD
ncbi:DUF4468 domain-containing protein [Bacteroidales bacterium OttesenSCG-928-I14]|nr:DUF4468 domain-containing protein [Bacteroidales bacterium OttesenSCG-928-I14]